VLLDDRLAEGMRRVGEDADRVVLDHRADVLQRGQVLPPFAGGELPEDGEGPQGQQGPGGQGVQLHGFLETEQQVAAVHLEAGDHHGDDQQGLRPVPEALIALVDVDAVAHFASPLRRVAIRIPPCTTPAPMAPDDQATQQVDPALAVATRQVDVGMAARRPSAARVWHSWQATAFSLGATMWVMNQFMRVSMKPNLPL
jgi:hypothetical protein